MTENQLVDPQPEALGRVTITQDFVGKYQNTVHPERVVVLPGYALRLLRHGDLSPKEMSLWVAFRQAAYTSWRQEGSKATTVTENIPHQRITSFAMMSRPSFFREVSGKDSLCGGLVESDPAPAAPDAPRQVANALRYKVSIAPRLTRRDMGILQALLEQAVAGHEGEAAAARAEKALVGLLPQSPGEYLDAPRAQVAQVDGWPRTLAEIARRVLGVKTLPGAVARAAEKLQERIFAGYGNVVITHYFLQKAAPALGLTHAQAWTIIALRDRVWFDYTTGERWPYAIVHGGLDELAALTGSSVKSCRRWFDEPGFGAFISPERVPSRVELPGYWDVRTLVFRVEPLEPVVQDGDKVSTDQGQSEQVPGADACQKVSTDQGQSEHRSGTKRSPIRDKVSTDSGQSEHPLNNFYKRYISFYNRHRQQTLGQNEQHFSAAAGSDAFSQTTDPGAWEDERPEAPSRNWTLRGLAQANTINGRKVAAMNEAGVKPEALAEWLAEAYTKTLTNPVGFAVQNALEYPDGRNPRASLFHRYSRSELMDKLALALAGYPMSGDFDALVRRYSKPNLLNLFLALGGDERDIPAQYVKPVVERQPKPEPVDPTPVVIPEHILARGEQILARLRKK